VAHLRKNLNTYPTLRDILLLDLVEVDFIEKNYNLLNKFDTVFALNVVEHINDDSLAIQNCYKLLKPGGNLIILVPAYEALYNRFDKELEHYRRYTQFKLNHLIKSNGFSVIHSQYFNLIGIFGWFFSGKILRKKTIPRDQMKLYNMLVPVFKIVDKITMQKAGLSVISVAKK
jgi:SAM-dependent methyltransferase